MRGTILTWTGDKGIVTASGQRYDFDINLWKGNVAPKADMTVELTVADGKATAVSPIADADLAKEKMGQLGAEGSKVAKAVYENVGKDVAIAYGVFAVAALFLKFVTVKGMLANSDFSIKLAAVINGTLKSPLLLSNGGGGLFWVLVAIVTIAVPYFWKHKYAPLAFCVPLLVTLYGCLQWYHEYSAAQAQIKQVRAAMGREAAQYMGAASDAMPYALSIGAYVCLAAGAYLAYRGIMRHLRS